MRVNEGGDNKFDSFIQTNKLEEKQVLFADSIPQYFEVGTSPPPECFLTHNTHLPTIESRRAPFSADKQPVEDEALILIGSMVR